MKTFITSILALLMTAGFTANAQDDYLGLPGDNLNLYAVMNLFQESATLEEFERNLNDENSKINNLDLNGDNYVDYIMVTDYPDGDVHNIVLQVYVSPSEKQDVAVFTVQKLRDGVQIQLIGDEALYGKNYIVEPIYDETPNPGYTGRRGNRGTVVRTTYYDIAAWPVIRFIYMPTYVVWRPAWHWGYYPVHWHAWNPYYYHYYYGYHHHYFPVYARYYRHWNEPRYSGYHTHYYTGIRSHSTTVIGNINRGAYKTTYSRPESRKEGESYARNHPNRTATSVSSRRNSNEGSSVTSSRREATTGTRTEASSRSGRSASGSSRRPSSVSSERRNSNSSNERPATSTERGTRQAESPSTVNSSRRSSSSETNSRPAASDQRRPEVSSRPERRSEVSSRPPERRPEVSSSRPAASSERRPEVSSRQPVSSSPSGSRRSEASAPSSSSRPQQSTASPSRPSRQSTASSSSSDRRSRSNDNKNTSVKKTETSSNSERSSRR
jgi:hypothetical protein